VFSFWRGARRDRQEEREIISDHDDCNKNTGHLCLAMSAGDKYLSPMTDVAQSNDSMETLAITEGRVERNSLASCVC